MATTSVNTIPAGDTALREGAPLSSGSTMQQISIGRIAGVKYRGAFRFDLSLKPPMIPSAATLTLTNTGSGGSVTDGLYYARRITQSSWSPATCTWNTYDGSTSWTSAGGDYTTTDQGTCTITGATDNLAFTGMATLVSDALANRGSYLDVIVMGAEANNEVVTIYMSDYEASPLSWPKLDITYTLDASGQLYRATLYPVFYSARPQ